MSRHELSTLALALTLAANSAPTWAQGCVAVEVHNVQARQGHLMLSAFVDAESFNKAPVTAIRTVATDAVMKLQVCGLSGSEVALTLFQDLDSDGKLSRNLLGVPSEPWGASGTPGFTGPQWETSKVPLNGSAIVVRLSQ